ncbi:MAG: hypothetical protein QXU97_04080 [Fervidicoccaceae archaeon]
MPCPLYRSGLCHSPKLGEPSADVVKREICGSSSAFTSCSYYAEGKLDVSSFSERARADVRRLLEYVHYVPFKPSSSCPEIRVLELSRGYVAYCAVLSRYLTKYEVELCSKLPSGCPLRRGLAFGRAPI